MYSIESVEQLEINFTRSIENNILTLAENPIKAKFYTFLVYHLSSLGLQNPLAKYKIELDRENENFKTQAIFRRKPRMG